MDFPLVTSGFVRAFSGFSPVVVLECYGGVTGLQFVPEDAKIPKCAAPFAETVKL